jgi:hypothetical protein
VRGFSVDASARGADGSKPIKTSPLGNSEGLWYIFDEEYKVFQTIQDDKAVVDVLHP